MNPQDRDAIAESLTSNLSLLDIHDVWDNAGSTRNGYVDPDELAAEMVEEVLKDFEDEWQDLSEPEEKQEYSLGIIKGLEDFLQSESEFKDWVLDFIEEQITEWQVRVKCLK